MGWQRNDLALAGREQHWGDYCVSILNLAVGEFSGRAAWAGNGIGAKKLAAVKRDQEGVVNRAEGVKPAMPIQLVTNMRHDRKQRGWRYRIKQVANLVVTWNFMNPKYRGGIVLSVALLQVGLAAKE